MKRKENLERQLRMLPGTWHAFLANGVKPGTQLTLEYTYRAPTKHTAEALLRSLGNPPSRITQSGKIWTLQAQTAPLAVSHDTLRAWVELMVDAGCAHQCEFDGFGAQMP
jgi:hypothetical protein